MIKHLGRKHYASRSALQFSTVSFLLLLNLSLFFSWSLITAA
jgi:hypothetical protein